MTEPDKVKPISQCKTLGEIMVTLSHLVVELNQIPSVKATMDKPEIKGEE